MTRSPAHRPALPLLLCLALALGACREDKPPAPPKKPAAPAQGKGGKVATRANPAAPAAKPDAKAPPKEPCQPPMGPVGGTLQRDTRWCGEVLVGSNLLVPRGVTLTVEPGTVVRFRRYRGYKEPHLRLMLRVEGTLVAVGSADKLVRFTSDDKEPRNGDWSMLKLVGSEGSRIAYAVLEFAQHGLNVWNSSLSVEHSVVRFNNWEGVYAENHGKLRLHKSRVYGNGYNCVAVEQFVDLEVTDSYIANCGTSGIHVDASRAHIQGNLVEGCQESITIDNDAEVVVVGNRLAGPRLATVSCGDGKNRVKVGGNVVDGLPADKAVHCQKAQLEKVPFTGAAPRELVTGVVEGTSPYLDYIPGDLPQDLYPYVYPPLDRTRRVVRKLGGGLGLTWSVAWDGKALWTANLGGKLYKLEPKQGKVLATYEAPGPQTWGMTHDGQRLWVNDFARRKIFALDPKNAKVIKSFDAPDPAGGCKGLAHDGQHLYALGWATHKLYQLSEEGKVLSEVPSPWRELGGGVKLYAAGGLAWDGRTFWAPADRLLRFGKDGKLLGWIHATSERVWGMAWDGEALWTTQRANENWEDYPRLFRVKVLAVQPPEKMQ